MGIIERREREKERRRNDIIDAAERVIFNKGYKESILDDIAKEAEVSKGTLYLYFKSKEELYLAIMVRGLKILRSMFAGAAGSKETGMEKFEAIGQSYIKFFNDYHNYFENLMFFEHKYIVFDEGNQYEMECIRESDAVFQILIETIQLGIEDGTIRKTIDPIKTSLLLWAQTTGVLQTIAMKREVLEEHFHFKPEELVSYYLELIRYLLRPEQG